MGRDRLQRFGFTHMPVRGAIVQLRETWGEVLARNAAPPAASRLLAQALAASVLMFSNVKFRGQIALQLNGGDGPLRLLLAQCTDERAVRGIVRCNDDPPRGFRELAAGTVLAINLAQRETGRQYQGIVPPVGDSLAEALEGYFRQSEQLPTRIWLAGSDRRASGMMLQRVPGEGIDADGWNRVSLLAETLTETELQLIPAPQLLQRLFHQEDLAVQAPEPVHFECGCSREKVIAMLHSLSDEGLEEGTEGAEPVEIRCEFCNQVYRFDAVDLAMARTEGAPRRFTRTRQ